MSSDPRYLKIVIAGEGGVGKTTLARSYIEGQFALNIGITLGVYHFTKEVKVNGSDYVLQIWDLGGQIRFRSIIPDFMIGMQGVLFLFDLTRVTTLIENISEWIEFIRSEDPALPILLIGAKCDLDYTISVDSLKEFMEEYNFFDYLEVSSVKMINVNSAFEKLASEIVRHKEHKDKEKVKQSAG